jgi:ketosteroid isomerase-like protein
MSDESSGFGQRAKSLVEQAKQSVGAGETPLATKVGGRAEAVEEALKAFGQGDIDRFLEAFSDDVTWSGPKGENFPGAGNHDGRDAIREAFVRDVERSFASFGFRPDHFLGAPDEDIVVAVGAFTGEGVKGEGQLDAPAVQVWEFDGDKVVAVDIYTDSAAFPGVVTEQEEKEREQEQNEEGDDDGETDGDGKRDAEDERDGGAESKGDGDGKRDAEAKGDAEGEGERRDDDEGDSDDDSRGRSGG